MSKQILTALLNCSWQWALLVGFIWLLSTRLRQSNTAYHAFWLLTLISLPILFSLTCIVSINFSDRPRWWVIPPENMLATGPADEN